jgi:serine/threonine-protein kinase BUR1
VRGLPLLPVLSLAHDVCSEVHKAKQKSNGRSVALKRILMHNEKEGMPVTALREIKILKALKHKNIIELLDMFVIHSTWPFTAYVNNC